ncbi:MAG: hypothetical protein Q9196_004817 [Gyalolechia fulgens]
MGIPSAELSRPALVERRRSSLLRPSLARSKGSSTTAIALKTVKVDSPAPAFQFGNGSSVLASELGSLDECFKASPPQERRPQSANSPMASIMGPPKLRQPFSNLHSHSRSNASSILGHVKKQSGNCQRPRKQFRRSLSMFEHPADVMKEQGAKFSPAKGLSSIMDTDDNSQLQLNLPHFIADEESLPRITKETMIDVLDGKHQVTYDQSFIVDCRFEYEYDGGHIDGAINVNNKEELASKLFDPVASNRTLLIFHCEYSAHRAPLMAKFLRQKDRAVNAHRYPLLTYPEVYILDGGYSSFFQDHRYRCYPQSYVEMGAEEHASACERGLGRIKQQRVKLCRAKTFAFGQQHQPLEDSPTGCGRQSDVLDLGMDISMDYSLEVRRILSRPNSPSVRRSAPPSDSCLQEDKRSTAFPTFSLPTALDFRTLINNQKAIYTIQRFNSQTDLTPTPAQVAHYSDLTECLALPPPIDLEAWNTNSSLGVRIL